MNIKTFYLGEMMTHCYLVWNEKNVGYLFDCGGENLAGLYNFIQENGIDLKYLVLTHGHGDHICGMNALTKTFKDIEVIIGEEDKVFLVDSSLSLARKITGKDFVYSGPVATVKEGDIVGDFVVMDTPGHTIGSKSFYCKEHALLLSGDTMFRRSFGRYDLPTSDGRMLFKSLKKLCDTLPNETKVYSGHTESTTIGEEKRFLKENGLI